MSLGACTLFPIIGGKTALALAKVNALSGTLVTARGTRVGGPCGVLSSVVALPSNCR